MTALAQLDGISFIAGLFLGAAVVLVWWAATATWDRIRSLPPREPLGVRHDRLDAEAARATMPIPAPRTRAVSSNRKAGRA